MISMQHGGRVRSLSISDSEPRKGIHTSLFRVSRPKYFQHGSTTYLLNIIVEQVKRLIGELWKSSCLYADAIKSMTLAENNDLEVETE